MRKREVALINMPFAVAEAPSIQVGLLKAIAAEHGIEVAGVYANLEFAAGIGIELYVALTGFRQVLIGEWVFSRAAFPDNARANALPDSFPDALDAAAAAGGTSVEELRRLREEVAVAFVAGLAERLVDEGLRVACLTSTFQQNVAALALVRALKRLDPSIFCLFGGANYDGPMGPAYMRAFDCIDAVVVGEADEAFPRILAALRYGGELPELPGVVTRARLGEAERIGRATFVGSLDRLPIPDYDDYFAALERHGIDRKRFGNPMRIPFESARGCWWGEKSHCTFCGLNGLGMGFREKSAPVVADELETLSRRHRTLVFSSVDNILGPRLRTGLVSELTARGYDFDLFYEIKANLTRDQIRDLGNAGIKALQPGIESLSSRLLEIMGKGIRAIQNVNTLRWMRHYGVWGAWNILYGFPGERSEDYDEQLRVARLIHHLQPPLGMGPVRLERFTPYFDGGAPGFDDKRPTASFTMIYPDGLDTAAAAYLFDADVRDLVAPRHLDPFRREVELWKEKWAGDGPLPFLTYRTAPGGLFVDDGRADSERPRTFWCAEPLSEVYLACRDRPQSADSAARLLAGRGRPIGRSELAEALEALEEKGIMLREGELYLSLAVPAHRQYARVRETVDA